jgi:8-oxo-dGTP pyrophosphatase MutT (NUDIX family)
MAAERAARIFGDGEPPERSLGLWLAAIRELFEEAGILLYTTTERERPDFEDPAIQARLAAGREDVHQRRRTLASLMQELGLYYNAGELHYLTRWITPVRFPMRFDARYFLCRIPTGQIAEPCRHEVTAARWIQPAEALGRWRAGELKMRNPTATTLMYLARLPECGRLFAAAQSGTLGFPSLSTG